MTATLLTPLSKHVPGTHLICQNRHVQSLCAYSGEHFEQLTPKVRREIELVSADGVRWVDSTLRKLPIQCYYWGCKVEFEYEDHKHTRIRYTWERRWSNDDKGFIDVIENKDGEDKLTWDKLEQLCLQD